MTATLSKIQIQIQTQIQLQIQIHIQSVWEGPLGGAFVSQQQHPVNPEPPSPTYKAALWTNELLEQHGPTLSLQ